MTSKFCKRLLITQSFKSGVLAHRNLCAGFDTPGFCLLFCFFVLSQVCVVPAWATEVSFMNKLITTDVSFFQLLIVGGSFGLREFTQIRYDAQKIRKRVCI